MASDVRLKSKDEQIASSTVSPIPVSEELQQRDAGGVQITAPRAVTQESVGQVQRQREQGERSLSNVTGVNLVHEFARRVEDLEQVEGYEQAQQYYQTEGLLDDVYKNVTGRRVGLSSNQKSKRQRGRKEKKEVSDSARNAVEAEKDSVEEHEAEQDELREQSRILETAPDVLFERISDDDDGDLQARKAEAQNSASHLMRKLSYQTKVLDKLDPDAVTKLSDKEMIKKYPKLISSLDTVHGMLPYFREPKLRLYMPHNEEVTRQLHAKAEKLDKQRDYLIAKMSIISSPYYALLRKEDTEALTVDELQEKADLYIESNPELYKYFCGLRKLKELGLKKKGTPDGVYVDVAAKEGEKSSVHRNEDGKKVTHKVAGKVASFKLSHDTDIHAGMLSQDEKKETAGEEVKDKGIETDKEKEAAVDEIMEQTQDKYDAEAGASASFTAEAHILEGAYSRSTESLSGNTTEFKIGGSVGNVRAVGKIGGSAFAGQSGVGAFLYAEGQAEATAVEASVSAEAMLNNPKWKTWGKGVLGAGANASGKLLAAYAEGKAKFGIWKNSKGETRKGWKTSGSAGANLVEGKAGTTFTIFGFKIKLQVTGALGLSANAKAKFTGTGAYLSLGACLGLGGGVKIGLDWSGLKRFWKEEE